MINEEGRVDPGSVEIVSSSGDAFAAAARRIVGSMRFSPRSRAATRCGSSTTLPVSWTIAR